MTIAELQNGLAAKLTKTDLDGYATQTWAQNQIKMTADGINGTMSSIKSTVDGQTTSINDLKADSSSFKSQFTTVNDTLGKQTTDIGSLQASSKELTSGFNTLTTDNTTNKNDISQLKQTATEVSSTLETVQTQVQNSAVGVNLLRNTKDYSGWGKWGTDKTVDDTIVQDYALTNLIKISGFDHTNGNFSDGMAGGGPVYLVTGQSYTFSVYAKADTKSGDGIGIDLNLYGDYTSQTQLGGALPLTKFLNSDWNRYNITFVAKGNGPFGIWRVLVWYDKPLDDLNAIYLWGLKLEKGTTATDYSSSPLDNATVTAVSKLSQTVDGMKADISKKIEQTDLNGYATQDWTQNQIKLTSDSLSGTLSSVKSTVDGHTTSINDLKADSSGFKAQFTTVNNVIGKQTTDISSLQASSKELTSGFNTLTTDNSTNKNDISQLKQTATEVSSTLETVKTQVQNSAVGTNLLTGTSGDLKTKQLTNDYNIGPQATNGALQIKLVKGQTYTYRAWLDNTNGQQHAFVNARLLATTDVNLGNGTPVEKGETGYSTLQITPPEDGLVKLTPFAYGIPLTALVGWKEEKLEKGNLATDWCPNPADNATVTAVSTLSQTVDGMKLDISKKIEQKDLNGYATQTWTQNQIKLTSDSLSATLSSVKSAVDGHTTSINALQADSSGFKAQFTTVNNTLGKHTTDIGTLQSTTKSLSASFDSLNADNATNKHNISQLQLTANSFSSTLATVQQQVTDSAVGTNLLANTADNGIGPVSIQGDTSDIVHSGPITRNSSYLEMTSTGASELYYRFSNTNASMHNLKPGQTYTIQGEVYVNKGDVRFRSQFQSNGGWGDYSGSVSGNLASNTSGFTKVKYTFTIPENATAVYISWQVFNFDSSTVFRFRRMKLEIGRVATDYSTSPLDNATITALSSISQTVDTIQTTVRGKVDNDTYQSKMTQINNAIIAKVSKGDITNENILPYSGYWSDTTGWNLFAWGASDKTLSLVHHDFYHNAADATLCIQTTQNATAPVGSSKFTLIPNTTYTFSFWGFASSNVVGTNVYIFGRSYTSTKDYDFVHAVFENLKMSPSGINKYTATFKTGPTETQAYIRLDNGGSNNGQSSGAYFAELKIERGDTATPYTRVSSSEIQVTSDNINLKVSKDGIVNAINMSPETTSIFGKKLYITAETYIDDAIIKSSMIDTITADKITTGTLNAAKINVINLNATSITTGTLSGANLSLNLNTGVVTFQHGRIHNAGNSIDINIDAGYMSVANGSNRVMLKNGEMQFVQPGIYDTSDNPYLRISNTFGGQSTEGAAFIGRKYAVLTNSDNATGNEMFDIGLGTEKFSGIATGYGAGVLNSGWHMTKVGGADRGVVISGGKATSYRQYWSASPSIMVGATQTSTHSGGMNGSNIIMDCDYLYNFSTWMRTSSHAANVYVADDGAIVRASSASKYKTNIERSFETGMGERILEVPTAHWFDKAEVLNKALDSQAPDPRRYFGMIAEDIDDAGLTELVEYNDKGEVEGIMYDRVTLTLIPIIRDYRDRITKLESEVKQLKEG
ncbi:gp58-like family protein [Lactiplantibacillus plantarum]|uniref:gp58-like family protein n=1 Tax=Lactiplantibacillus plantarum TaxID=1590 RepID=UPI0037DD06A4